MSSMQMSRSRLAPIGLMLLALGSPASAQIILSGNENKIDLTSGIPRVIPPRAPDSISILNFSKFPPSVQHSSDIPNSVIGPPSNIAITPDRRIALISNSLKVDPQDATNWVPESFVHVLDLTADPPKVVGKAKAGRQPSGLSITPNGRLALVANRADGTISILSIRENELTATGTAKVWERVKSVSYLAIRPDCSLALASRKKRVYLIVPMMVGDTV